MKRVVVVLAACTIAASCAQQPKPPEPPPPAPAPAPVAAPPPPPPPPPPAKLSLPPDFPQPGTAAAKTKAQTLVRQAFELLDQGDEDKAKTAAEQAALLDPENKSAACLLRGIRSDPVSTLGRESTSYTVPGRTARQHREARARRHLRVLPPRSIQPDPGAAAARRRTDDPHSRKGRARARRARSPGAAAPRRESSSTRSDETGADAGRRTPLAATGAGRRGPVGCRDDPCAHRSALPERASGVQPSRSEHRHPRVGQGPRA